MLFTCSLSCNFGSLTIFCNCSICISVDACVGEPTIPGWPYPQYWSISCFLYLSLIVFAASVLLPAIPTSLSYWSIATAPNNLFLAMANCSGVL